MKSYNIHDDPQAFFDEKRVRGVLELHPVECVFELDAPRRIMQRLSVRPVGGWLRDENRDEFRECWQLSEIYCPHEGIDRRAEYGMTDLLKA